MNRKLAKLYIKIKFTEFNFYWFKYINAKIILLKNTKVLFLANFFQLELLNIL
jgi:hypothetical protein